MKKNTASEIEDIKKEMALRKEFFEFKNIISAAVRIADFSANLVREYVSTSSVHKGDVVCGYGYSFKQHSKSPFRDIRNTDIQYLVYEKQIDKLRDRLARLSYIDFEQYKKHRTTINKLIFGADYYNEEFVDMRDEHFLEYFIDTSLVDTANQLSNLASNEELLENSLPANEYKYLYNEDDEVLPENPEEVYS